MSTYLLKEILGWNCFQDIFLACFLNLSSENQFVQHKISFLEIENDIQLTYLQEIKLPGNTIHNVNLRSNIANKESKIDFGQSQIRFVPVLTLPKYLSRSSTYLWIISSVRSSLSSFSIATQKYKLAYLWNRRKHGKFTFKFNIFFSLVKMWNI